MKIKALCSLALAFAASVCSAAPPADAPAGTTGKCKDGSYSDASAKKGACRGHKGVAEWYAAAAPAGAAATAPAAASGPAAKPAPADVPMAATAPKNRPAGMSPAAAPAPGGGPGMVWANTSSKVYHCSTDKWYGRTKQGQYMSEGDAKSKGYHAEHGKACG